MRFVLLAFYWQRHKSGMKIIKTAKSLFGILTITAALALQVRAQTYITDIVTYGANSSGSHFSTIPDVWDTRPSGPYDTRIQSLLSGVLLNGPSDAAVRPDIALSPGAHSFRICGAPGADNAYFGINLFFNN